MYGISICVLLEHHRKVLEKSKLVGEYKSLSHIKGLFADIADCVVVKVGIETGNRVIQYNNGAILSIP